MSTALSGVLLLAFVMAWLLVSLRFRAGKHRAFERWYRSNSAPRAFRNLPVVSPVMYGLLLPLLLVAMPVFLGIDVDLGVDPSVAKIGVLAAGSYLLLSFAASAFLLYRLPQWLLPSWLREEDERIGYVSAPPDWFDKLVLGGLGLLCLGIGVALFVAMVLAMLHV